MKVFSNRIFNGMKEIAGLALAAIIGICATGCASSGATKPLSGNETALGQVSADFTAEVGWFSSDNISQLAYIKLLEAAEQSGKYTAGTYDVADVNWVTGQTLDNQNRAITASGTVIKTSQADGSIGVIEADFTAETGWFSGNKINQLASIKLLKAAMDKYPGKSLAISDVSWVKGESVDNRDSKISAVGKVNVSPSSENVLGVVEADFTAETGWFSQGSIDSLASMKLLQEAQKTYTGSIAIQNITWVTGAVVDNQNNEISAIGEVVSK
jgi:hypothetical protein